MPKPSRMMMLSDKSKRAGSTAAHRRRRIRAVIDPSARPSLRAGRAPCRRPAPRRRHAMRPESELHRAMDDAGQKIAAQQIRTEDARRSAHAVQLARRPRPWDCRRGELAASLRPQSTTWPRRTKAASASPSNALMLISERAPDETCVDAGSALGSLPPSAADCARCSVQAGHAAAPCLVLEAWVERRDRQVHRRD